MKSYLCRSNQKSSLFSLVALLSLIFTIYGVILRNECSFDAKFSLVASNTWLEAERISVVIAHDEQECIKQCVLEKKCQSINYHSVKKECELLANTTFDENVVKHEKKGWTHYQTDPMDLEVGMACSRLSPCPSHFCIDTCDKPGYKCTCRTEFNGTTCANYIGPGMRSTNSAISCKWLKEKYSTAVSSGFYWIQLSQPTLVYCDMDTLDGGWVMIGNFSVNSIHGVPHPGRSFSDDVISLANVSTGHSLLSGIGLQELHNFIKLKQIRYFCKKPWHNRTVHITTLEQSPEVLKFLLGETHVCPQSCGSYNIEHDDTSVISRSCQNWGTYREEWSWCLANGNSRINHNYRIYDDAFHIRTPTKHVVNLNNVPRIECDDHVAMPGYNQMGLWQYFAR